MGIYIYIYEVVSCYFVDKYGWKLKLFYGDIEVNKMFFSFYGFIVS